jgi:hypothetical protein
VVRRKLQENHPEGEIVLPPNRENVRNSPIIKGICGTLVAHLDHVLHPHLGADYATSSGQSRLFGDVVWVLFIAAQAADGVCTYVGLRLFGIGMEGNPLIGWYAATFGIGPALAAAKLLAATCAAFLHTVGRHVTLASLTIVYLIGAVWPWVEILWP